MITNLRRHGTNNLHFSQALPRLSFAAADELFSLLWAAALIGCGGFDAGWRLLAAAVIDFAHGSASPMTGQGGS
ncbi:MAG: hypothetical protein ABSC47_07160 [Terracidiphilus sp.]